jgi:hypothetical protein
MHALYMTRIGLEAAVALACGITLGGCGGGSASPIAPGATPPGSGPPAAQTCRTYSTQQTTALTSSDGAQSATIVQSCTYDSSANELACTLNHSDSSGFSYSVRNVARYASAADFVDEVRVVPPLSLATGGTIAYTPASTAPGSSYSFAYDAQRRQTQRVFQFTNGTTQTVVHTGWDAAGRPTGATLSIPEPTTLLYAYNDAARSYTITTPSVGGVQTHTFNADGNLISLVATVAGRTTTQTVAISGTGRVCK